MESKAKCLLCGAECDGSRELTLKLDAGWWVFWTRRRVKLGELCRACVARIAPPQFREVLKEEEWMRNIR